MPERSGRLIGLGVGPGDPELVTLKTLRRLGEAAVIAYPAPEHGPSFARSIVAAWLDGTRPEIAIRFPMQPGPPPAAIYDEAAARLAAELDQGRDVALLCQGDPFFYGSFISIFARLAEGYPIEIVPGVSSLTACAAAAAMPLVGRDEVLSVVPATLNEFELVRRLAAGEVVAIVKLGRHLAKVQRVLARLGRLDRSLYIEHATLVGQRVIPLATADSASARYFSMALVPAPRCQSLQTHISALP